MDFTHTHRTSIREPPAAARPGGPASSRPLSRNGFTLDHKTAASGRTYISIAPVGRRGVVQYNFGYTLPGYRWRIPGGVDGRGSA
jgi:hypothetical protein